MKPPEQGAGEPAGFHPGAGALARLCGALSAWGRLVVEVGASGAAPTLEQVIGGLVEWMGNELMDGWLHLPIPVFETASGLAEELFQASQAYLAAVRGAGGPVPDAQRSMHEARIRGVLERVVVLEAGVRAEGGTQRPGAGERG